MRVIPLKSGPTLFVLESMANARPALARHIRDQRIDDLLSSDEEPQMWA